MREMIVKKLKSLHRDEQGADMVEYILVIAVVALPLVGVLVWFRKEIVQWAAELWEAVKGGEATSPYE